MRRKSLTLRLLRALGLGALFAVATSAAPIIHLQLPGGQRVLGRALEAALDQAFLGQFEIGAIERADISGLVVRDVEVRDPDGKRVLSVSRLRAQADVPALVRAWVFGGDAVTLVIDHVHVDRAELRLRPDPKTQAPTLLAAFTPRPSPKPRPPSEPSRPVRVTVQAIELTRAFVRGRAFGSPTLEVDLSSVRGALRARPEGADLVVRHFGTVVRGLRGADLSGVASVRLRTPGWVWASFDGHFGDVQLGAVVHVEDDGRAIVTFDVPRARPAAVRALLPEYPLLDDASVELEAEGRLPVLSLTGQVAAGDARVLVNGPVRLDADPGAELEIDGKNVDLRLAVPKAPPTRLDLRAALSLFRAKDEFALRFDATTRPTRIEGLELPAADVTGTLAAGAVEGHALLHEPGLPTELAFRVDDTGTRVQARARRVRLERVPRLKPILPASGLADVNATLELRDGKLSAEATADVTDFRTADVKLGRAALTGRLTGKLAKPEALQVDATLAGTGLGLGELPFDRVRATVSGPIAEPRVAATLTSHGPRLDVAARVRPGGGGVRVTGLELAARNGSAELAGSAHTIDVRPNRVTIRDVDVGGLGGTLRGSALITPNLVQIEGSGRALNLRALSELFGLGARPRGQVDVDADIVLASDVERGHVRLALSDVALGAVDGLSATVDATLERGTLEATARAELAQVGTAQGRLSATLGGSARELASYRDMLGEAELSITQADLGLLGTALAAQGAVKELQGKLTVTARFTRDDAAALPSVALTAFTQGLRFTLPDTGSDGSDQPTIVQGMDVLFGANVDGESGVTDLNAQLVDGRGVFALGSLRGTVDLTTARRAPHELDRQLLATPVVGKLLVSERSFDDLPTWLPLTGFRGRARAEATLEGTLAAPEITARLSVGALALAAARNQRPIDVCATIGWQPSESRVVASGDAFLSRPNVERCQGPRVVRSSLQATVARDGTGALRPVGTAALGLEGLPLDVIPGLGDVGVSGRSFGNVSVTNGDGVPRLAASLEFRDTRVQGVAVGDGRLRIQSDERSVGANLTMTHGGGKLLATALAALDRSQVLPSVDTKQPLFFRVTASQVDAVVLSPVLRDVLSEIGGRVNGDLTATLVAQDTPAGDSNLAGSIQGHLALDDGDLQLAGLGLRLSDVSLRARAETVGAATRITIDQLSGLGGRSGERVRIRDGRLWLEGVRLVRAEGSIEATELPLMLEGVPQASATSHQGVAFRLERKPDEMQVDFDVPYLLIALPQSSGRAVISIDENDSIEIVQPLGEPIRRSGEGVPWRLRFKLGDNVRVTRSDLDLPLKGRAEVLLADQLDVRGDLELTPGGRLKVSEHTFIIESGEVHFDTGDPANPSIRVSASWRAPDDTVVFATVRGTLKNPSSYELTSSPPKTQEEILALLLGYGGSDDSSSPTPSAAGALVGAQQLLAPLLQNTPARRVALRTNEAEKADRAYTTYTAAVPLSENIWFEGSYHQSRAPDSTYDNAVSGTIDWRFRPHWSLRTEIGTIGTGLDLVWQYRY